MRKHTLQVRFPTQAALRAEFEKNISNRGIFVATEEDIEIRQSVAVEIVLVWAGESTPPVALRGEVVHRVTPGMAARGSGRAGVAVQFEESVAELRARFEPLLGAEPLPDPDTDQAGERRRSARREAVRVPVRVEPARRKAFSTTSRDLSGTGVLLSLGAETLAVGEVVRIGLRHPAGEPAVEIDGRVVRDVKNKQGGVAAVAVAFDRNQAALPKVAEVIEALRQASHQGRLGGIAGSIVDLGLANMLQMFGSSTPQGTLVVERDGEQGYIAFSENQLVAASLGGHSGKRALEEMLGWNEGRFEFEARVDPGLLAGGAREPLAAAVLEAVCARDERGRPRPDRHAEGGAQGPVERKRERKAERGVEPMPRRKSEKPPAARPDTTFEIGPVTTFSVDFEQAEIAQGSLDKTQQAVLDLARAGMSLERIESVIPEPAERIRTAVSALVEMGVLIPG